MPARAGVGREKKWEGTHQAEGAGLSDQRDIYSSRAERGQHDCRNGYEPFSADCNYRNRYGYGADCQNADDGRDQQHSISCRIENLSECGDLVESARKLSVDPVCGAKYGQQDRGSVPVSMMRLNEEHYKDWNEHQPGGSYDVRKRQDPVFALSTRLGRQVLDGGAWDHGLSL